MEQPKPTSGERMSTPEVTIYTTQFCGFCMRAKALLDSKNVDYIEIAVDHDAALRAEMAQRAGARTVPQIWIGEQHIGGCQELYQLEAAKKLDPLLNTP